ncbi:hypothetical protein G4Y79_08400 [Phototrophicus methaneseepsis]|uniref:Penicillin-binding protein 2 n=1 Tax=Phototrophicus methaneseepsis TaxID=2710758 RepID=A0A7S8ECE1_9CHLR|nr:penicillin-binding transpeptidase domain-containing protein [Phototrophicus methaneseepsis]QPC84381.1 hypothetical protein G4Y79_08400 [Phototrophicus methaneseepsis]
MIKRFLLGFLLVLGAAVVMTGCSNVRAASAPMPTLIPTSTPAIDMVSAQRVAALYFDAWERNDFSAMYQLITRASQEAEPFDEFQALYQDVHNVMTLNGLTTTERAMMRQGDRYVVLTYDVNFDLDIMDDFSDTDRELHLVIDPQLNEWRVAWTVGDLFREMNDGATLNFVANQPSRANIYDRNGDVLADQNGVVVITQVIPQDIPDLAVCINSLSQATGDTIEELQAKFDRSGSNWVVEIGAMQTPEYEQNKVALERDCNATFKGQAVRRYPRGELMPHILGNVGYPSEDQVADLIRQGFDQETIIGQSGLEESWDTVLRGTPGGQLILRGTDGSRIRTLSEVKTVLPESIWLTIDDDLQEYVARVIGLAYAENAETWAKQSKGASAIVLNIHTGEILAMVTYPTYNNNALTPFPQIARNVVESELDRLNNDPGTPILNRPVQGTYPSGSVMKVADTMAALDSGVFDYNHTYYSTGSWTYNGDTRYDWTSLGHGRLDFSGMLRVSCNSCFYDVGFHMNEVDPYLLPNYLKHFGLGQPTGLTDIAESTGLIPDPDWIAENRNIPWGYSDAVNMAIGQGELQVTPLQMADMYTAIANGGTIYVPQLVRERGILDQRTFVAEPEVRSTLDVPQEALDVVRRGLCQVTTDRVSGTAAFVFNSSYDPSPLLGIGVCGKTGTAEDPANPGTHAWFIGYAPSPNPDIAVAVMVENAGEGSEVAAPLVKYIMEYYFFLREDAD